MKSAFTFRILLLSLLLCTTWPRIQAYDFVKNSLYYTITDTVNRCVEVSQHDDYRTLTEITIPETVTYLGETYTVTGLGDKAFAFCSELSFLNLPNTLRTIEHMGLYGCTSLHSIDLPESLQYVGELGFHRCGFTTLRLPSSLIQVGSDAFTHLQDLVTFEVDGDNLCFSAEDGVLYNKEKTKLIQYPIAQKNPIFSVPSTVAEIGRFAFDQCSNLIRVSLPNSLTRIDNCAFYSCQKLKEVYIPNSVTSIGDYAFNYCYKLSYVHLPASPAFTTIPTSLFCFCPALTSIEIPDNVQVIQQWAFEDCTSLSQIILPSSIRYIGGCAFRRCSSLQRLVSLADVPPVISPSDPIPTSTTVFVNKTALSDYQSHPVWKTCQLADMDQYTGMVMKETIGTMQRQMPADWADHGVIVNTSQLSTNKQETTEGYIPNLIDGDTNTFFQSTWSEDNANDDIHYLQVDMRAALQFIKLKYQQAYQQNKYEPKTVRVCATNDMTEGWTEICTANFDSRTGSTEVDLGYPYRYLRLYVLDTFGGLVVGYNKCFAWSEFGVWNNAEVSEENQAEVEDIMADVEVSNGYSEAVIRALERVEQKLAGSRVLRLLDNGFNYVYTTHLPENYDEVVYSRHFSHTNWQAIVLPFDVPCYDICYDRKVARLNDIHQYDDDEDGMPDRTILEVFRLQDYDVLRANTPYLIKSADIGVKDFIMTTNFEPMIPLTLDCSSIGTQYSFYGAYHTVLGREMFENHYYAMDSGCLSEVTNSNAELKPFRWYMKAVDRAGNVPACIPTIQVVEYDDEGYITSIESFGNNTDTDISTPVYDLNGRQIGIMGKWNELPRGVYVVQGKMLLK